MTGKRYDLPRPIRCANGEAVAFSFTRLTIGQMVDLSKKGDILSAEVTGAFAESYGQGVTSDGATFALTPEDVTKSTSQAPALVCAQAFIEVSWYKVLTNPGTEDPVFLYDKAEQGESFPKDVIVTDGEAVYKLRYPFDLKFKIGNEEQSSKVEWLIFRPQQYREIQEFVRLYVEGSPNRIPAFILAFGRLVTVPEGYPLTDGRLTERTVMDLDAADGERISDLVMPNFIETP